MPRPERFREPSIHELLASLRRTARRAIEWGEENIQNPAVATDPRWDHALWCQCSLLGCLDQLDPALERAVTKWRRS